MLKRRLFLVLVTLIIGYVLLVALVMIFQRQLLYLPTQVPEKAVTSMAAEHGFVPWKNEAGQIIGWKIPATSTASGSVLICHGNAGCAFNRDYLAGPIHEAENVDVYVLEYPGYGARGGSPSKASIDAAAAEAFNLLPTNLPIYLVSESIGTGAACDLAHQHPQAIAGMALIVPYHDLASVAQSHFWFLPAYFLLFDRFNPARALENYHGPVQFLLAGADEIIGVQTGQRLYESYAGPKRLEVIAGAHHNDVAGQLPSWWRDVFAYWQENKTGK